MFEENVPNWYTPKIVELIEAFEPDQYGNIWYSVVMEGDAETFMWLAKNEPEEGKKYYGHLEKTKSGKRLRFKTDKVPDNESVPKEAKSNFESVEKQDSINKSVSLNNAVLYAQVNGDDVDTVLGNADIFLLWLKAEPAVLETPIEPKSGYEKAKAARNKIVVPAPVDPDEEVFDEDDYSG